MQRLCKGRFSYPHQRKFGRNFRVTDSTKEMRLDSEINHMGCQLDSEMNHWGCQLDSDMNHWGCQLDTIGQGNQSHGMSIG